MQEEFEFPPMDPNRIIKSDTIDNPMSFVIFNTSEINKIDFNEVFDNNVDELRYSIDSTKTFIKFRGELPDCLNNIITKSNVLTCDEINEIMHNSEWNN
jgi:hypothetical protein